MSALIKAPLTALLAAALATPAVAASNNVASQFPVRVLAVQPAGKRRLSPLEWAHGRGVAVGDRFDTTAALPA